MKRFIYLKFDGTPSKEVSLPVAMSVAGMRVIKGRGPFQLARDEIKGPKRTRLDVLSKLRNALKKGKVGSVYQVFKGDGKPVFRVREVQPAYRVEDTNGNAKADRAWSAAKAYFGPISFLGAYVCKTIVGSGGTMSQHSYGNAVDIGAPTMDDLERIWDYFVAHADEYDIDHAIVNKKIWTRGADTHYYSGETHYHVHLDFTPQFYGRCGVKP